MPLFVEGYTKRPV